MPTLCLIGANVASVEASMLAISVALLSTPALAKALLLNIAIANKKNLKLLLKFIITFLVKK